jgi:hypothetical protein
MMNCRTATRLFSERQERPLDMGERLSLRFHCMMCLGCANYGRHMDVLRQITRAYAQGAGDAQDEAPGGAANPRA